MYQDISSVLGDSHAMFYHPRWPISGLRPVSTLDQCLDLVNDRLDSRGRTISGWPPGEQDQAARLLWVNWIYNNLQNEPIRKPILAHREHDVFHVDCGDTRLMALSLGTGMDLVSVVVTDRKEHAGQYQGWVPIHNNQELLDITGFSSDAVVLFNATNGDWALDWLEIGDNSTAHHMHDVDQRVRMIENYLSKQDAGFRFDREWAKTPIEWADHDTIDQNLVSIGI